MPELLRAAAPPGVAASAAAVVETERVLASVLEAVIGACYLHAGYERTAAAVVEAFAQQIDEALEHPVDFKSALQERLARRGAWSATRSPARTGPPHDRTFAVAARVAASELGSGSGRSKKLAEQEAARTAPRAAGDASERRETSREGARRAPEVDHDRRASSPSPSARGWSSARASA